MAISVSVQGSDLVFEDLAHLYSACNDAVDACNDAAVFLNKNGFSDNGSNTYEAVRSYTRDFINAVNERYGFENEPFFEVAFL